MSVFKRSDRGRTRSAFRVASAATGAVALIGVVGIGLAVHFGSNSDAQAHAPPSDVPNSAPVTVEITSVATDAPAVAPDPVPAEFSWGVERNQASFYFLADGHRLGTDSEHQARPGLSLTKLYIAEYVLEHGTVGERYDALHMLSDSNDCSAQELYTKYPDSVDHVAEEYGLSTTRGAEHWGESLTSTYDVVTFIAALKAKDPAHPILVAMSLATENAADGYGQDFGTSQLPGAIGTKWGWSDDRELHSSVSFGDGWVAAAAVAGGPEDLTKFSDAQLGELAKNASR